MYPSLAHTAGRPTIPATMAPDAPGADALADYFASEGIPAAYARNAEIAAEGDAADYCWQVRRGTLRSVRLLADGRRQIGGFHIAGDIIGLESGDIHAFAIEAVEDCELLLVRRRRLLGVAAETPKLAAALFTHAAADFAAMRHQLVCVGRKTAQERLSDFLLEMAGRLARGREVQLPMPRQDVADYLGLTIETVSRGFTQLEQEGLIALPTARCVRLADTRRLAGRAGG